jgi:hypothetical protein
MQRKSVNVKKFMSISVFVLATPMTLYGAVETFQTITFVSQSKEAQGIVVGWKDRSIKSGTLGEQSSRYPRIQFQTENGQLIEFISRVGYQGGGYRLKQSVPVLFNPDKPTDARINSFESLWLFSAVFLGIGLFAFLVAFQNWKNASER